MEQNKKLVQFSRLSVNRRSFITTAASVVAATSLAMNQFFNHANRIKAIAFDAFPIFDPRPVFSLIESMYPEQGIELSNVWRTKQFEYCWLRTSGKQYKDFWKVTEDALVYAAKKATVELSNENKKELMNQYLKLDIWEGVLPVLEGLKKKDIKLSFVSNMTDEMLTSNIRYSKIENYFDYVISTDKIGSFKPDPKAYQLGVDILKLKKEEILFVAFAGWDAVGAKWFGYPTYWVNRLQSLAEEMNIMPDGVGEDMSDLLNFINHHNN